MKRIILLALTLLLLLHTTKVSASENFLTDYDVNYNIRENEPTLVTHQITLTNNSSGYYASSYKILVGFNEIKNVRARDPDGQITPEVTKTVEGTQINLNFNKRVVGKGNKLTFDLSFETDEILQREGLVKEINIPGFTNQSSFSSIRVAVNYPKNFNTPAYIKPAANNHEQNKIVFTKSELGSKGMSIGFGEAQIYQFNLRYNLENKNLFPVRTELALPPDTNYQKVIIDSINPKPTNVRIDSDGNWMATYHLAPTSTKRILVKGKARVILSPSKEALTKEKRELYLRSDSNWQSNNTEIAQLAQRLKTPENIYKYVVENLNYDFSRLENEQVRLGAAEVLKNKSSAVCLEFSDLFIALARAAGIPAREVNGYASTKNSKERPLSLVKDVLHAWPEYYDDTRQAWIMIDPTWGNTTGGLDYFNTFDFAHLAFVIRGHNSNYPIPAGGYKFENSEEKDISVSQVSDFREVKPKFDSHIEISNKMSLDNPVIMTAVIKNESGTTARNIHTQLESPVIKDQVMEEDINIIPPFGQVEIPITIDKVSFLTNINALIRITVNNQALTHKVQASPIFQYLLVAGGILIASIIIIISIIASRRRSISVPQ